jgi:DNA segregation ATPase FtsK/SpoIIIE, S-DNA-T family
MRWVNSWKRTERGGGVTIDQEGRVIPFPDQHKAIEPGTPEPGTPEPGPEVVEAELLDEPSTALAVDQPHDVIDLLPWQQPDDRRPIIPPALTKEHRGPALRWYLGRATHRARYHAVRAPWYQGKTFVYAPRGFWRVVRHLKDWVTVADAQAIKSLAVRHAQSGGATQLKEGHTIYHTAERNASPKIRARRIVLTGIITVLLGGAAALWLLAPRWGFVLAMLGLIDVLGYAGRPVDKPLIGPAVIGDQYVKLTPDMVIRALSSTGISALSAKDAKIDFAAPIARDGDGWRADVDLPLGTTATEVTKVRPKLASGLRRPLGCVWPEGAPDVGEHRLVVWVGDKDLAKKGYVRWPLANRGRHDFFDRMPFGEEPRGRVITIPLFQQNVLIGAIPGQGKTAAVRCIACAQALDPTVELWIHELAGKGDLDALEKVSHRFVSGIDDASIAYAAKSLRMLRAEVERRAAALKLVPDDMRPDKRITREISDRRSFKLWPLVAIFDEVQNLFNHGDYGKQAGEDAAYVIRLGRALGVVLIFATQRPDRESLPTGVSGNVSLRFCLYVPGQVENDMVLGTSSYQNGLRATFPNLRSEVDAGIGIVKGATPVPLIVKVAYLNGPATERIAKRARGLREAAGTLSGVAIGAVEEEPSQPRDPLADALSVFLAGETWVSWKALAERLSDRLPEGYAQTTPDGLSSTLRDLGLGIESRSGRDDTAPGGTRKGVHRAALERAVELRGPGVVGP